MENVDDERRQLLEEATELDHIWGVWEGEEEPTNGHREWIRQPSQSGNDMRHHIKVHASHREQVWESPSASLIEQDPEVIPDVNHLRQGRDKSIDELKFFIRAEVELQERLEATGYRPPTWRLLLALQSLLSAVQLQGESARTAPALQVFRCVGAWMCAYTPGKPVSLVRSAVASIFRLPCPPPRPPSQFRTVGKKIDPNFPTNPTNFGLVFRSPQTLRVFGELISTTS